MRDARREELRQELDRELLKRGLTRRDLVKGGMGMAAILGLGPLLAACGGDDDETAAPATTAEQAAGGGATTAEEAPAFTGTLRATGLGVDLIDPIREAGEAALGFSLAFDVTDTVTARQKITTQPGSMDIFSGYFNDIDQVWPSGNLLPIERARIERWDEVASLFKVGRLDPDCADCTLGDGDAPFRKIYVDENGEIITWADPESGEVPEGTEEPALLTAVPGNFNMDSLGYNGDVIQLEPNEVSWAELFNPEWKGRVAVLNDPSIGMQDTGNAAVAMGLMEFGDLGNMTREEIDGLIKILTDLKRQGQFRAFWTTFDESVNFMSSGEVVIESMWSPAVALLVAQGFPVRYAAPPEGFRGWTGALSISREVEQDPAKLQAAYDYINWWHSGEPGAIMMRQGYYNAVQETTREFVEPGEFAYWIEGEPADKDYPGPFGEISIPEGTVRDGGSLQERGSNYSSWNSLFDEQEYQVQRWNEFLAS